MVKDMPKMYIVENDHRLHDYCKEKGYSPNSIPIENFIEIAEDIGWVMSSDDYVMHHNTRTLPKHYYLRTH